MAAMFGMIQGGKGLGLAFEAGDAIRIGRQPLRKDFDRDVAVELGIAGAIDLAHAAFAQLRQDVVGARASSRSLRHPGGAMASLAEARASSTRERRRAAFADLVEDLVGTDRLTDHVDVLCWIKPRLLYHSAAGSAWQKARVPAAAPRV